MLYVLLRVWVCYQSRFCTIQNNIRSDYFNGKNCFTESKRALRYIHSHTLYVGFTVRVEVKLRC